MNQRSLLKEGLLLASKDTSVGQKCFENIAHTIGQLLKVDYVLIGLLSEEHPTQLETVSLWIDGKIVPNLTYELQGTPCEKIIDQKICLYENNVSNLFPKDLMLKEMDAKGYLGVPIYDMNQRPIGLLALITRKAMIVSTEEISLIEVNAARVGVEIDRIRYEKQLKNLNNAIDQEVRSRTLELESITHNISENLVEAEEKYRMLFENNTDALVMSDPDNLVTFESVNKAAVHLFGAKDVEELLKFGPVDLSPEFQADGKLSKEKAFEMVSIGMKHGSHIFEWQHKKTTGEVFDCTIVLTCITIKGRKLIQASMRDITESKKDKDLLIKKEKELEYAERVAKLGRWSWDIKTNTIHWSEVLKDIFRGDSSVTPPPFEGLKNFYSPESWNILQRLVERAIETGEPYEIDLQSIGQDGSPRWSHTTGSVIERDSSGKALKIAGTVQDISDRKKLENDLHDALKSRDVFMGVASHELKTPLTTLQLQIHSLLRILKADNKEFPIEKIISKLNIIKRQGNRFEELIKTLLDISQINSGRLRLQIEQDMNLSELVEDIAGRFNEEFIHANSDFKVCVEPQVKGDWDPQRIEQIISNLLTNALKYGEGKPVEIILRKDPVFVYIEVRDHGIGIAESARAKIFERFERAVEDHSYKGLGLGLWIVREIVTSLQGEIWFESEIGKGSRFITKLPLKGKHEH